MIFKKKFPKLIYYFGTEDYEKIVKELGGEFKEKSSWVKELLSTPSHTAYLKISEGCDHPCSFCAIPIDARITQIKIH